ncbi:hypothetical protein BKI52_14335 [marine bacterium AO1-C]|nr:hypothetical protein BKI52_14335 [marine bacterium AO1-C]
MKFIRLLFIFCLVAVQCKAQEANTPSAEGVWKLVLKADRKLVEDLHIYKQGNQWKATLGKTDIPIAYKEGKFVIDWKSKKARFDGEFAENQQFIKGFWRQYQYASPVKLTKTANGWKGTREVQFHQLTVHLVISTDKETGKLKGYIYNYERNMGAYVRISRVEQKGRKLTLYGRRFPKRPMNQGVISEDGKTLDMPFDDLGMEGRTFRKVDPEKDIRMTPRVGQKTYTYTIPKQTNDGWQTTSLAKSGADMGKIKELMEAILTKKYPSLHSLLITHNNQLVLEEYFYGHHRDHLHDTRSSGKSLASTMIGLAMDRNLLNSVDQKVVDLFPQFQGQIKNLDARKKRLRIRDLMTMATGLACNDNTYKSPGNEDRMQYQTKQPDWVKYTLDLPMVREPGEKAVYCSGGVNVLGQIVSNVSRKPTYQFLHENLFEPLGINRYVMNMTPVGNGYLGGGIYMRPRDLAKFGQLFVNEGTWKGKRIISKKWVQAATKGHSTMNGEKYKNYGYNWWITHYEVNGEKYDTFAASGNGGQLIIGIPKLNLVVTFNAGNYSQYFIWKKYSQEIIPKYIIPALAKIQK